MTVNQAVSALGQKIGNAQDNFIERIARLPSTNIRIFVTLALYVVTGAKYVSSETWQPSLEWLAFLITASGLDTAHFLVKRKTQFEPPTPDTNAPTS